MKEVKTMNNLNVTAQDIADAEKETVSIVQKINPFTDNIYIDIVDDNNNIIATTGDLKNSNDITAAITKFTHQIENSSKYTLNKNCNCIG
jgi:hypothetical protein